MDGFDFGDAVRGTVADQRDVIEALREENAKLRDAMYTKAGKYALHHMDEDELRIWATQQAEHIEELKEAVRKMYADIQAAYVRGRPLEPYQYETVVRELGIEAEND